MVLRRRAFQYHVIVCVILLCAFVIRGSQNNRKTFQTNEDGHDTPEIHQKMAEQIWIHCRKLIDKDWDFTTPHEITRRNREAIPSWFLKCVELFFGWSNPPRRYLTATAVQTIVRSHSPKRTIISQSQSIKHDVPSPSPSPPQVEAPDPFFRQDVIDLTPSNSPLEPSPPKAPADLPSLDFIDSPPPLPPSPPHKHYASISQSEKNNENSLKRIIYFGTAAGIILLVFSMLLCCCFKKSVRDGHKRDEKPLLTLTSSDFSADSSQKSISIGNASNKELKTSSGKFSISLSMKSENFDSPLGEATSTEASLSSLKNSSEKPTSLPSGPPPPPPAATRPPPPPKARPPPAPPKAIPSKGHPHRKTHSDDSDAEARAQKAKLKPFFWDKTVLTNPDQSMVWNEISAGSFQFNEEMIETLFGYNNEKNKNEGKKDSTNSETPVQYIQIIETKKAQNLAILLRALNVTTEEVLDALQEGNELPVDLLQTLLKVQPTSEEELKLRLYSGDVLLLGPAERFLKILVDIPFAFKRLESLLFMCSFQEEVSSVKESLTNLEVACNKLRSSRLFLKLLEAVLKTGNRMNDGTYRGGAQAFRLDTLLKLADVKGTDGKTTLLHFVVKEIIRSEGVRAARTANTSRSMSSVRTEDFAEEINEGASAEHYRSLGLEVVSGLSNELEDVRKAAVVDVDSLTSSILKMGQSLQKTRTFVNSELNNMNDDCEFYRTLASFIEQAEADSTKLLEEEKRIMALVKSTTDYFHGNAGKDEGLHLFVIVRDFLIMLDKVCREVKTSSAKPTRNSNSRKDTTTKPTSPETSHSLSDVRRRLFPAIAGRRMEDSSSDEDT
ncbi:hypothetical protein CsatB_000313 [Cannabis sativa]